MPERCTSVSVLLEAMRHMICNTVVPNMTGLTSQPQTKSSKRRFSTITLSAFAHRQPIISTSGWGTVPSLRLPACHHSLLRDFLDVAARRQQTLRQGIPTMLALLFSHSKASKTLTPTHG
eukprot:scaffold63949_cov20-Tisochrysis_lutea.AAC.1